MLLIIPRAGGIWGSGRKHPVCSLTPASAIPPHPCGAFPLQGCRLGIYHRIATFQIPVFMLLGIFSFRVNFLAFNNFSGGGDLNPRLRVPKTRGITTSPPPGMFQARDYRIKALRSMPGYAGLPLAYYLNYGNLTVATAFLIIELSGNFGF